MSKAARTPVMRQYLAAKEAHPDALLLFRMGDFYELFFDDAVTAARALDLTLTARNKGAEDEVPMAGVPHHAASGYIHRLLERGFKVAICEQMADPSKVKGIVPREVVRVVSPGIVYDEAGLKEKENHYLAAVDRRDDGPFGLAALDLSTGELLACEAPDLEAVLGEIARLDPRELLVAPSAATVAEAALREGAGVAVRREAEAMTEARASEILDAVLGAGEALASCPSAVARAAAARCLATARACEGGRAIPVTRLVAYDVGDALVLDETTVRNLELVRAISGDDRASLLAQVDATRTSPGARLLRRRLLAPRTSVPIIRRRLDAVELFVTQPGLRGELRGRLEEIADLERLATKVALDRVAPRDLGKVRTSLAELPRIAEALARCPDASAREALGVPASGPWIDPCEAAHRLLERALSDDLPLRAADGGVIREGFDPALDETRALTRDGQRLIVELEARLRESSLIPTLKLRYTRVFGWYIEVTRSHLVKAPPAWRRKQTVSSGERFTCDELDELADKLAHAEERFAAREAELFARLVEELRAHVERLRRVAGVLAEWDVAAALAEVAHRGDYARPEIDDSLDLVIEEGRHPVVERLSAAGRFVPNDVTLAAAPPEGRGDGDRKWLWLVTGPNMAGKSTLMRQVAILVILAQAGSFVPARRARIGVVDRILTRVGASDNLARGESTFMVEMKETANVLRRATRRSLVVLDEIGRGTSTFDGLAIAWAVAEHLVDAVGCRALFATHYHELTELAVTHPGCANVSVSAKEYAGDIVFLHKLAHGAASRSYGVACARLAGVPELVLSRARTILAGLEERGELPNGARASSRAGRDQLGLFDRVESAAPHAAVAALASVDPDRLTPLAALQLVAQLKRMVGES